ncbi:MAG TPA: tRNA (adenosine(37)-N6)-threonylcarbamoyltransferase complex transferase subunit TsaD [Solirubrobacteraceae bacterium]|jgi:N6-L-threonylcarbamoyladenine synthase
MSARDRLLAIETSCDETAAAVVDPEMNVLSSVVHSQAETHAKFGGVVPDVASREHVARIVDIVDAALEQADTTPDQLAAVAVTKGPGLPGSLAVGVSAAKSLALGWDLPLVAVNHLEGHLFSVELAGEPVAYPAVILLVSGGHCMLVHARERGAYELLGQTRDDSVGEAYDKVARELDLGYPGGPILDRLAAEGEDVYALPRPLLDDPGLDFSFSGLKTAVRRLLEKGEVDVPNLAASFAAASTDVLVAKTKRAVERCRPASVIAVGGVSASPILRRRLVEEVEPLGVQLVLAPLRYATDNAAMIGAAAWWRLRHDGPSDPGFGPSPRLPLGA